MLIFVNHKPSLFQDSLSPGSSRRVYPCTSAKIPRNQLCSSRSTLSHVYSGHIQLVTLVIAYLLAHLSLLLLQAGDIETNPGPQTPGMPVHCLVCIFECKFVYKTVSTFVCDIIITLQSEHQLQCTRPLRPCKISEIPRNSYSCPRVASFVCNLHNSSCCGVALFLEKILCMYVRYNWTGDTAQMDVGY